MSQQWTDLQRYVIKGALERDGRNRKRRGGDREAGLAPTQRALRDAALHGDDEPGDGQA